MYLIKNGFLLTVFFLLFSVFVEAQTCTLTNSIAPANNNSNITVTTTVSGPVTVCSNAAVFTVSIKNTSPFVISNLTINPQMPVGMRFVSGSQTVAALVSAVPLNDPTFSLASIAAGTTTQFTYSASAGCDIIPYLTTTSSSGSNLVNNKTQVIYSLSGSCFVEYEANGSGSYLIAYPTIGFNPTLNTINDNLTITIGQIVNRPLTINNTGTGNLDTLTLTVTYPGELTLKKISVVSGSTLIPLVPVSVVNNVYTYLLTKTVFVYAMNGSIPNTDGNFDPDESLFLEEQVQGLTCGNNGETVYQAVWGCNQEVCNPGNTSASTYYHASVPTSAPYVNPVRYNQPQSITSLCENNGGQEMVFRYYNDQGSPIDTTAPNMARDIQVVVAFYQGVVTTSNYQIWNNVTQTYSTLSSLNITPSQVSGSVTFSFANNPAVYGKDIDGIHFGLSDLDNDGYYDDLAVGMYFQLEFNYSYTGCRYTGFQCQPLQDQSLLQSYALFNNQCVLNYYFADFSADEYVLTTGNSGISGPIDVTDGTNVFTFTVGEQFTTNSGFYYFSCDPTVNTNYRSEITVPAGFSYPYTTVNWLPSGSTTPTPIPCIFNAAANKLIIYGGASPGSYSIPFTLNCASGGASGNQSIQWTHFFACDSCISCEYQMVCKSFSVVTHCGGCTGVHTSAFHLQRSSLGWVMPANGMYTDAQFAAAPKVTATTAGIDLSTALEYDTINMVIPGYLSPGYVAGTFTGMNVQINYTLDATVTANLLQPLNATFRIYKASGGTYTYCPVSTLPVAITSGTDSLTVAYVFSVPSSCFSTLALSQGDSIILITQFQVLKTTVPPGIHTFYNFRAEHYGVNAGGSTGCESFGTTFRMIKYNTGIINNDGGGLNCSGVNVGMQLANVGGSGAELGDFPNEFRPYSKITQFWFQMPTGFHLVPQSGLGAGQSNYQVGQYVNYFSTNALIGAGTPDPLHTNQYTWVRSSSWNLTSAGGFENLNVYIAPDCQESIGYQDLPIPIYFSYTNYEYTRSPSVIEQMIYTNTYNINGNITQTYSFIEGDYGYHANLALAPAKTQIGTTATVNWPVTISNYLTGTFSSADAINTWFAVEPTTANITSIKLSSEQKGPIKSYPYPIPGTSLTGYMFCVGTVPGNQMIELSVAATYTNCVAGKIEPLKIYSNWSCSSTLPVSPETAVVCNDSTRKDTLFLKYETATLTLQVDTIATPQPVSICAPIEFDLVYRNPLYANVSNLQFTMNNLTGFDPTQTQVIITYPYQGGTPQTVPISQLSSGVMGYDISGFLLNEGTGLYPGQLPGIQNPSLTDTTGGKIGIKVLLTATCSIDPGFSKGLVQFTMTGMTNCGNTLTVSTQHKPLIQGFDPLDQVSILMSATAVNPVTNTSAVSISIQNNSTFALGALLPNVIRYFTLSLPAGVSIQNFALSPVLTKGNVNYYAMPVLAAGAVQIYTATFLVNNANGSCEGNAVQIMATTVMDNNLTCGTGPGATSCPVEAVTASATVTLTLESLACQNCISSFAPIPGQTYVLSTWVKEGSPVSPTLYIQSSVSLIFAGANDTIGPFTPSGEIINGWQRIYATFTVPSTAVSAQVLLNSTSTGSVYFDDIRIHPFNSNMKSYVYDPFSLRLWAELDENNYATFYEYDEEGSLVRVKKETERGVQTIQESRSSTVKK